MLRIIECVRCHDIGMSCNVSSRCKFPVPVPFPLYSRSYLFVRVPVYPGPRLVFDSFRPAPVFGEKIWQWKWERSFPVRFHTWYFAFLVASFIMRVFAHNTRALVETMAPCPCCRGVMPGHGAVGSLTSCVSSNRLPGITHNFVLVRELEACSSSFKMV